MPVWLRRAFIGVVGLAILAALIWAFRPTPVPVDTALVRRGALAVTVDEDGRTRIKERYVVSSPLGGRLRRIQLDPGDPNTEGET
ncbi:MAG: efflux transporter periplasmic adaptor subunit, partial [Phycisphaerae bacterium]|nr:efflux transporter periplasmic adaptor subunit [Phycisphaerae bacterium]